MPNNYGLPNEELEKKRQGYKNCVYCHKSLKRYHGVRGTRTDMSTIEHLNHLPPWDNIATVTFCCGSCNSSRSNKKLLDWFKTPYCKDKKINETNIAEVVRKYIFKYEK